MEIQFEVSKIDSYSKALAEKVCMEFFGANKAISGSQILSLTPVDQINFFVLKTLFDRWKAESVKLKSPYFNYDNSEVLESLKQLQNKLSQNILIQREHFKPLLEQAIANTLWLILKPEVYFENEYSGTTEIKLLDIKDHEKYYRINKNVVQHLIRTLEWEKKEIIAKEQIAFLVDKLIKENPLSNLEKEQYLNSFNSLLKFQLDSFVERPIVVEEKKVVVEAIPPKPVVVEMPKTEAKPTTDNPILNEKFLGVQLTVNDLLKSPSSTLADKIGKTRIETIKNGISLSQKFMFINALFKGASNDYEAMLTDIDSCSSYDEALSMLGEKYSTKYKWDFDQYEVKEFIEIVERKFA
jgi:hypothetical protein